MNHEADLIAGVEKKLRFIAGDIKRNGRKILRNYPLTSPQFIALQCIIDDESITIGQLSKRIGLAFSTTTDLIDRLEENNLVKRIKDSKDRRVVRISVLEKGDIIIREVIAERQKYLGEILSDFSIAEAETLKRLLNLLQEKIKITNDK